MHSPELGVMIVRGRQRDLFTRIAELLSVILVTLSGAHGFPASRGRIERGCARAAFVDWREISVALTGPVTGGFDFCDVAVWWP